MCLSFTTVGTATEKLYVFQKNKQQTIFYLPKNQINTIKNMQKILSLFVFEKNKVLPRNYPIFTEFSRTFLR